jgi:hypothetical protein
MRVNIIDVYEDERGCGRRKEGGKYLVSGEPFAPCGRLPVPLHRCPTCSSGIKPARGWTRVALRQLLTTAPQCQAAADCQARPLGPLGPDRVGLLWVGTVFYPTVKEFMREAVTMGISRRISQIPKEFEVGKTWVLLAHRQPEPHGFTLFRPERIEYVVRANDSEAKLERLAAQGLTLVRVHARQVDLGLAPPKSLTVFGQDVN